jgi:leucyl/phenylalanyl-tRNA--protein transferase
LETRCAAGKQEAGEKEAHRLQTPNHRPIAPETLEYAYRNGIFPMGDPETGEIHWYQPDPRAIFDLDRFHAPRRLLKTVRGGEFTFTVNLAFGEVIRHCARSHQAEGMWITEEIIELYTRMHKLGKAHSVEAWSGGRLAGGLYGVAFGGAFMGESMFHIERDASKACLVYLVERLKSRGFVLLDTQFPTEHLAQFGISLISHRHYLRRLRAALALEHVRFTP